jgi:hypothetical protein
MPTLQEKKENAIDAVGQLIALLERCREYGWASKFIPIKDALEDHDFDKAIYLFSCIPMPNMGGFLDLILSAQNGHLIRNYEEDNALLEKFRGLVSKTISNLRLYLSYEIDRPLVKIPRGA